MNEPLCARRDPALFDSIDLVDHFRARAICAGCPVVQACLERALAIAAEHSPKDRSQRGPDGTWAGLLWLDGSIHDLRDRKPRTRTQITERGSAA